MLDILVCGEVTATFPTKFLRQIASRSLVFCSSSIHYLPPQFVDARVSRTMRCGVTGGAEVPVEAIRR